MLIKSIYTFVEPKGHSPDRSGNPFGLKAIFFLAEKNDQRKFLFGLEKNDFRTKD